MADDNTIQIAFEAIDRNVKKTVEEIDRVITGLKQADVPDSLKNSTMGETDPKTKEFLADMRAQFEEARGAIKEAKEEFTDFEDVSVKGAMKSAAAFSLVVAAAGFIVSEMNKIVELSKDNPELFSAPQLENITAYGDEVSQLKEQLLKTKIEIVTGLAPALTTILERSNANARAMELAAAAGEKWAFISEQQKDAFTDMALAEEDAIIAAESYDKALIAMGPTISSNAELTKEAEKAIKERADAEEEAIKQMTKANQGYLDDIGSMSDQYENKAETAASIAEARADIEADLAKARADGWQEGSDKIQGYLDKLSDLDKKEQEAAENWEENIAKRKLAMLEELLSADGELTEAELQSLEEKGVAWGLYTEEAIAQEQALHAEVQGLANDIMGIPDRTINIEVNATGSGLALIGGEGETKAKVGVKGKKAAGGPVSGGDSYLVGEQGPELFTPGASGQITSNANLGGIDEKRLARLITAAMLKGLAQQ